MPEETSAIGSTSDDAGASDPEQAACGRIPRRGESMPVSQNGYTANSQAPIRRARIEGTDVSVGVRRGPAGDLLLHAAARWHREVEPLRAPDGVLDCWGYAPRTIRGSTTLSNHASGTALDLRARAHPLGRSGTFRADQVAAIRRILADCRFAIRWGGDYRGRKDEMHIEIVVDEDTCRGVLAGLNRSTEEDDLPSADDIARAVWNHRILNGFGDWVPAQTIITAHEVRTDDVQRSLAALTDQVAALRAQGVDVATIRQVVTEALAAQAPPAPEATPAPPASRVRARRRDG